MVGLPPGSFVLKPQQQCLIAQQFYKVKEKDDWKLKTVSDLRKLISPEEWTHSDKLEAELVQMLHDDVEKIIDAYKGEKKKKKKEKKEEKKENKEKKKKEKKKSKARNREFVIVVVVKTVNVLMIVLALLPVHSDLMLKTMLSHE